jgi:hypothetical protein
MAARSIQVQGESDIVAFSSRATLAMVHGSRISPAQQLGSKKVFSSGGRGFGDDQSKLAKQDTSYQCTGSLVPNDPKSLHNSQSIKLGDV